MANTMSCADPSYVFLSFENLLECDKQFGYFTWTGAVENNTYSNTVWQCVNDYCQNPHPDLGGCDGEDTGRSWTGDKPFEFAVYHGQYNYLEAPSVCGGVASDANSDMAGPGVYVSYLMQLGIIFYLFLFLRAFRLVPKVISYITRCLQPRNYESRSKIRGRGYYYFKHHDSVLKAILVEFQEAQCFFMIACQAATLAAETHRKVFQAHTLEMLWATTSVARMVSAAGILPVVLAMWCLRKWHRSSPYIFLLSCITFILSQVSLFTIWTPDASLLVEITNDSWPESCGGQPPPLRYCLDPYEANSLFYPSSFFYILLNPFCLVMWGLSVIAWVYSYLLDEVGDDSRRARIRTCLHLSQFGSRLRRLREKKPIRVLLFIFTLLVELLFIFVVAVDAYCFWFFYGSGVVDFSVWSFGQLVAIAVWLPVAAKYILLLTDVESYSRSRLPGGYRLIQDKTVDNKEEDFSFTMLPTSSENVPGGTRAMME